MMTLRHRELRPRKKDSLRDREAKKTCNPQPLTKHLGLSLVTHFKLLVSRSRVRNRLL